MVKKYLFYLLICTFLPFFFVKPLIIPIFVPCLLKRTFMT